MSYLLMKKRIEVTGETLYNEQIKNAQDVLKYGFKDDVSYNPNIFIYNSSINIPIKMYDQKYTASFGFISKFLTECEFSINLGEILYDIVDNDYWMCIETYNVSNIHNEGKLAKCSRFIKWQDKYGNIHEIPVIALSASKYNNGEDGTSTVMLGSDQLMLYTQCNKDTLNIERGMNFFIDENLENATVYRVTRIDSTLYTYMGTGFIGMILTETDYTPTNEELILGVCNYRDITTFPSSDESVISTSIISGSEKIKVGISKIYSVNFFDKDKNKIDWRNIHFEWNIISDFDVIQNIFDNKIELIVNNEDYIDSSFLLQIIINNNVDSEMKISVIDIV